MVDARMTRRKIGMLSLVLLAVSSSIALTACSGIKAAPEYATTPPTPELHRVTPTSEPAEPSNPGEPGEAVHLTGDVQAGQQVFATYCAACHGKAGVGGVPNPGSDDGTVPSLNPIDPTLANPDPQKFALNIDLFIQHGSAPEGDNPQKKMPAWGDTHALTQQQIADVMAYVISLNQG